jgi:hypothetical protein
MRVAFTGLVAFLVVVPAARGRAQIQTQFDAHGDFVRPAEGGANSWGGGVALALSLGAPLSPIQFGIAPGIDMTGQQHNGPTTTTAAVDLTVQPGGSSSLTPYAGVSAGANWNRGHLRSWDGTRASYEVLAGLQFKLGPVPTLNVQERYGYIVGQPHQLTTRAGLLLKI